MVTISAERPDDRPGVERVVRDAFDGPTEARLVDACRESPQFDPDLSLVAREDGTVVGQALFTPVRVGDTGWDEVLVLAPLGVAPAHQRSGIGSRLVEEGLERGRERGYCAVLLHGDPAYYERFGFSPAEQYGIENPEDTPSAEFVIRELEPGALESIDGPVEYLPAFETIR